MKNKVLFVKLLMALSLLVIVTQSCKKDKQEDKLLKTNVLAEVSDNTTPYTVTTAAGSGGIFDMERVDGPVATAKLYTPLSIDVGPDGKLYFDDYTLRVLDGATVKTLNSTVPVTSIAVDKHGTIY